MMMEQALYSKELNEGGDQAQSPRFLSRSGISLKPNYYQSILTDQPDVGFFELHAENYLRPGGPARYFLNKIREVYPISIHGVGLSIGGENPLDEQHLNSVATLVNEMQPEIFSEHLAWSSHNGHFLNDLLPVAYDQTTLDRVCQHIDQIQNKLQKRILIENPSTYFSFTHSDCGEIEFIQAMAQRTGCGLLLDVNNVEVSCFNNQGDPEKYLQAFPMQAVGQIHLAGHTLDSNETIPLKIDSHDEPVANEVWSLYELTLKLAGDKPTLIERDGNLPPLRELLDEATHADSIRQRLQQEAEHAIAI
ncbi:MNIO family bufferin maturase [Marinomonas epiphytica]